MTIGKICKADLPKNTGRNQRMDGLMGEWKDGQTKVGSNVQLNSLYAQKLWVKWAGYMSDPRISS